MNTDVFHLIDMQLLYIDQSGHVVSRRGKPVNVLEADIGVILPGEGAYSQDQLLTTSRRAIEVTSGVEQETMHDAWLLSDQDEPATLAQVCNLLH